MQGLEEDGKKEDDGEELEVVEDTEEEVEVITKYYGTELVIKEDDSVGSVSLSLEDDVTSTSLKIESSFYDEVALDHSNIFCDLPSPRCPLPKQPSTPKCQRNIEDFVHNLPSPLCPSSVIAEYPSPSKWCQCNTEYSPRLLLSGLPRDSSPPKSQHEDRDIDHRYQPLLLPSLTKLDGDIAHPILTLQALPTML
ncbi:hypothetical protein SCP_0114540 [Sparassis crispa]|uniref:Uncharacterized protein n=1 Tax=Sparassis crispa TaxID=139825 RepID=A0A401G8S3_9APHY|nr:hypothetical protein SCP_0114540 [Sparassis crispa]GBE78565.1 hypothetical protein SCP_0114540 [Sparassis crispa]